MAAELKVKTTLNDQISSKVERLKDKFKAMAVSIRNSLKKISIKDFLGVQLFKDIAKGIGSVITKIKKLTDKVMNLARSSVNIADNFEGLEMTLEILKGTHKEAVYLFEDMREWGRTSPLQTNDIVQSFVRLNAIGLEPTKKSMGTLGNAALIFQKDMADVLDGYIGLNKRTLRQLGIDINRTGSKAILISGNIRKETEKDSASIRRALLELWEERFPDALEKASTTSKAQTAIMKSNFVELGAAIGKKLQPVLNTLKKTLGEIAFKVKQMLDPNREKVMGNLKKELTVINAKIATYGTVMNNARANTQALIKPTTTMMTLLKQKAEILDKINAMNKEEEDAEKKEKDAEERLAKKEALLAFEKERLTYRESYAKYLKAHNKLFRESMKDSEANTKITDEAAEATAKLDDQIDQLYGQLKTLAAEELVEKMTKKWGQFKTIAESLGSVMGAAITAGFGDAKQAMKQMLNTMIDFVTKQILLAKIAAKAQLIIDGGIWNPAALGKLAVQWGMITALASAAKSAVANFADGTSGPLQRSTMATVGERGPEKVYLPAGSQVRNNRGSNMPSSGGITVNFYSPTGKIPDSSESRISAQAIYNGVSELIRDGRMPKGAVL